jgi:glutamate dehydrogenase (NAD(P)+)
VAEELNVVRIAGARVAVQGFGAVGRHAARFLGERGALVVAVSDSGGGVVRAGGLDLDALVAHKRSSGSVTGFPGAEPSSPDLVAVDCDVWIPAARPDVLTAVNAFALQARLVLEGANIPATREAEEILSRRGVVVVPDFIANAGGVICAAVEYAGGTESQAFAAIEEKIGRNARAVLERSAAEGITPRMAAERLASERVEEAMSYRR